MIDFLKTVFNQPILFYTLVAGLFASLISGLTGTLISLKNISYISGGIAHAILGGIGIAYFLGFNEYLGAIIFALVSALIISLVHFNFKENENVIIGALWAVGMATGIIFMHISPGYTVDLTTYIFGSIILLSKSDLILIAALSTFIAVIVFIFYRQFIAIAFDFEHAELKKLPVKFIYTLLLSIIALSVVILVRITGLILLIALFTLPAAISRMWLDKIFQIMFLSALLCFASIFLGFYASYELELPAGAVIVLSIGLIYFISLLFKIFYERFKKY